MATDAKAEWSCRNAASDVEFPIIGMGASAGHIDAFHLFFERMPCGLRMAFVMILHLPADRHVDGNSGALDVDASDRGDRPGSRSSPDMYVPPPHAIVTLNDGHLRCRHRGVIGSTGSSMPFLIHWAQRFEKGPWASCSRHGSDGSLGLKAIKGWGGHVSRKAPMGRRRVWRDAAAPFRPVRSI